jgi:hypothetical protein
VRASLRRTRLGRVGARGTGRRGARVGGEGRSVVEAGGNVEGRCQSRARERLRRELTWRDAGELASGEHGSWSGTV